MYLFAFALVFAKSKLGIYFCMSVQIVFVKSYSAKSEWISHLPTEPNICMMHAMRDITTTLSSNRYKYSLQNHRVREVGLENSSILAQLNLPQYFMQTSLQYHQSILYSPTLKIYVPNDLYYTLQWM